MLFGTENIEIGILCGIRELFGCEFMDWFMKAISFVGNAGAFWIVVALVLIASKGYRRTGIMVAIGLLLGLLIGNLMLKNLICRPRPCWISEDVGLLIASPKDYSFPSGHTLASFISAIVLIYENRKVGICAMVVACVMAFSRMYLFVHFPTDIIGGIILGWIIATAVVKSVRTYERRKQSEKSEEKINQP